MHAEFVVTNAPLSSHLVRYHRQQFMLDGGPSAEPPGPLVARLVSDARSELRRQLRTLTEARGLQPTVAAISVADVTIEPRRVTHTSHPTWAIYVPRG